MNPLPIQLGLTTLFAFAFARMLISIRASRLNPRAFLWAPLYACGLAMLWFPDLSTRFAHLVGVNRGVDAILYLSIALLSYIVLRLYVALEKQDQAVTRLVSEIALRDAGER